MGVREIVTERILRELESGNIPWNRPWTGAHNAVSSAEYRGINRLLLPTHKYTCNAWLTFNQCRDLGGWVKKDERGAIVVFYKRSEITITDDGDDETIGTGENVETGEKTTKNVFVLRYYTVFNVEQTTLDPAKYTTNNTIARDKTADEIYLNYDCPIKFQGSTASYSPGADVIYCPPVEHFKNTEGFYGTLFHEIAHSTGHKTRLNRNMSGSIGSASYAREELIAEIASAMILQSLGMTKTIENAAAYCRSWISVLQNDKNMIITASGQAEKAYQYVCGGAVVNA